METETDTGQTFKVSSPLPVIPKNADKETVVKLLTDYATENNFTLVIARSKTTLIHFSCKKGGKYQNWRNLKEENRKRVKKSGKTGCPYRIKVGKGKGVDFQYIEPTSDKEYCHNHPLDRSNLLSSKKGRENGLTPKEVEKVNEGIERNFLTKTIQKSISFSSDMNKLTVNDIYNMKYGSKNKMDLKSDTGATILVPYMESKHFVTKYRCDQTTKALDGLFLTNETLLARTKRFPEVVIIDATYNTNDLRMPFICAYGVSNLGGMVLKTFPIAFAWVATEKEHIYSWFLETLRCFVGEFLSETTFATNKSTALMNQLDKQFGDNRKLLCTWHLINNLDSNCNKKIFQKRRHHSDI